MPTYSIDGPDGKTYSIDGPAGATREQVIEKIKSRQGEIAAPETSMLGDVAKSFGRGIAKGAIGLAGLPGDVSKLVGTGVEKAGEFAGLAPRPVPELSGMPSSGTIEQGVEKVTGKFGEPETTPGKFAQSVGEFVPSAVLGPGGKITRAATTLAGGLGAEAGAELTGSEYGRFVGGLAGGFGAGLGGAEVQERRLASMFPSKEANVKSSKEAYDQIKQANVQISPPAIGDFVESLKQTLERDHFITPAGEAKAVFDTLDRVKEDGNLARLMDIHSSLGKIDPTHGRVYAAATVSRPAIREFVENLQPPDLISGDAKFVNQMWGHARDTWRIGAKLEEIEQAQESAAHRRTVSGSGMNLNTLRQEFRKIIDSDKRSRGYSDAAKKKMEEIVEGTLSTNLARKAGKVAPGGAVSLMPSAAAYFAGGTEAAAAVAGGGVLAHYLEGYLTHRQIRQLEDLIRRESPLAKPVAAQVAGQEPNWRGIAPAASLRSALATHAESPLAPNGQ